MRKLQDREKRALLLFGVAAVVWIILFFALKEPDVPTVVAPSKVNSIPEAEMQLARMRQSVARVPGKEDVLAQAMAQLSTREKGLIVADTANQAQEKVMQILRRVASAQSPPVDIRSVELGAPRPFGDGYGEVAIAAVFECRIEQLVQMLADITARPELIATSELRIASANPKQKTVNVRVTVSGIVPKSLVPEKKAGTL